MIQAVADDEERGALLPQLLSRSLQINYQTE